MLEENEFLAAISDVKGALNKQLQDIAGNFHKCLTDQVKILNETCLNWFNSLKQLGDDNASKIRDLRKDMNSVIQENNSLKKRVEILEAADEYKTDHAFRLQLVAYNIPETVQPVDREDCHLTIRDFFINSLEIREEDVNFIPIRDTHRLGKKQVGSIRPIVIAFCQQQHRDFVLSRAKKLKGSRLGLQPHLSKKLLDVKKVLLAKRKEIKDYDRRVLAFISYRSYRPILLVKRQDRLVEFQDSMSFNDLQFGANISNFSNLRNLHQSTPRTPDGAGRPMITSSSRQPSRVSGIRSLASPNTPPTFAAGEPVVVPTFRLE